MHEEDRSRQPSIFTVVRAIVKYMSSDRDEACLMATPSLTPNLTTTLTTSMTFHSSLVSMAPSPTTSPSNSSLSSRVYTERSGHLILTLTVTLHRGLDHQIILQPALIVALPTWFNSYLFLLRLLSVTLSCIFQTRLWSLIEVTWSHVIL